MSTATVWGKGSSASANCEIGCTKVALNPCRNVSVLQRRIVATIENTRLVFTLYVKVSLKDKRKEFSATCQGIQKSIGSHLIASRPMKRKVLF